MPSITLVKDFQYRGALEEYSNTYHFDGGDPTSAVRWKALADALILSEKTCFPSSTRYIRAFGHKAGVTHRDWVYDYLAGTGAVAGTLAAPGLIPQAGDAAVWLRWATDVLTSRGKPIYLRSYYHDVWSNANTRLNVDTFLAGQKTALETYGAAWITGFSDGVVTHHRAGPNGAIGLAPSVASQWLTTRTLERRGRRRPV
jgi:hypothetical protein